MSDSFITARVKSNILFNGDVKSINYSIKTVGATVHIMGIAQNQAELDKVLAAARGTSGVKKVISYVKVKDVNGADEGAAEEAPETSEAF
jgi:osmotically-inducible protein OsmY